MLQLTPAVRIFLASSPTDMRNSIDGLSAIVQNQWGEDVFSGHLFVFVSRRGDRVKILTWGNGGFVLYYKRLEQGRFRLPSIAPDARHVTLDATQLAMLLDGIDYCRVRQPKRWAPQKKAHEGIDKGARI
ncbi:MAG TPA: IS66 family insertion sequence element accessory protein TnpB [Vulgatibacter sp.]|nr:IS66 family insertion sequence element accessory protein TnpB [Vulgatibacter sp.]